MNLTMKQTEEDVLPFQKSLRAESVLRNCFIFMCASYLCWLFLYYTGFRISYKFCQK